MVTEEQLDKNSPWTYFDGAFQNQVCGGGVVLHLSDSHYFHLQINLGSGSNNYVELLALKLLLALEKYCRTIQIFGYSMLVVNWINCW